MIMTVEIELYITMRSHTDEIGVDYVSPLMQWCTFEHAPKPFAE